MNLQDVVPDWMWNSLDDSSTQNKTKKKKECVTHEQKEQMLNFITENPEMITHSSTRESEQELWKDLTNKLNSLKPEKTTDFWKAFWSRWSSSTGKKPESALRVIDLRVKKFLGHIGIGANENKANKSPNKKKLTMDEINDKLNEVEAEHVKIKLDIDEMDYKILKYKNFIQDLEKKVAEKRKRGKQLTKLKCDLNQKRRKLQEKD